MIVDDDSSHIVGVVDQPSSSFVLDTFAVVQENTHNPFFARLFSPSVVADATQ
jgi:hypothetical protein